MKRRDFLKLICIAPIAPRVLATKENPLMKVTKWDAATNTVTIDDDAEIAFGNDYTITFDTTDSNDSSCVIAYYCDLDVTWRRIQFESQLRKEKTDG